MVHTSILSFSALPGSIWIIFGAFWSSISIFSHFDNFGYKSYVDLDEIWCGSLLNPILPPISNWYFSAFSQWIWMIFYVFWSSAFIIIFMCLSFWVQILLGFWWNLMWIFDEYCIMITEFRFELVILSLTGTFWSLQIRFQHDAEMLLE